MTVMSREERWKGPEGAELICMGKDMKLTVAQKRVNLEARRREQGGEVKFEGRVTGKVRGDDDWDFGGQKGPMRIFIYFYFYYLFIY